MQNVFFLQKAGQYFHLSTLAKAYMRHTVCLVHNLELCQTRVQMFNSSWGTGEQNSHLHSRRLTCWLMTMLFLQRWEIIASAAHQTVIIAVMFVFRHFYLPFRKITVVELQKTFRTWQFLSTISLITPLLLFVHHLGLNYFNHQLHLCR